jgi:hypothetical protein
MKKTNLLFFVWFFFVILTFLKIFVFPTKFLIIVFFIWLVTFYARIHYENKIVRTPHPVYLVDPRN